MSWIQNSGMQRHTQTGIKSHRPASSHVRRPHWNWCTVVDFLMHVAATHRFLLTLQRHTWMISYSFSYSYSGKQKRRKTRKWQVIRTDSTLKNHQVVIPEPFPEPCTLVSYPSGKKKEDHEDDAHYSAQKNPTPLLRHTECDSLCTFLICAFSPHFSHHWTWLKPSKKEKNSVPFSVPGLDQHRIGTLPKFAM